MIHRRVAQDCDPHCFAACLSAAAFAAIRAARRSLTSACAAEQASCMKLLDPWQGPQSRVDKLKASLAGRLPAAWPAARRERFLAQVGTVVTGAWGGEKQRPEATTVSAAQALAGKPLHPASTTTAEVTIKSRQRHRHA